MPSVMASAPATSQGPESLSPTSLPRFAEQLHAVAAVMETLTYRLLEFEERLAAQESCLAGLNRRAQEALDAPAPLLDARLQETEERLARIEELLSGFDNAAAGRRLQALPAVAARQRRGGPSEAEAGDPEQLFYEEGEQPFMDERTA